MNVKIIREVTLDIRIRVVEVGREGQPPTPNVEIYRGDEYVGIAQLTASEVEQLSEVVTDIVEIYHEEQLKVESK